MGDEDDGHPLALKGLQDSEELRRLLRREDRGRLVEDHDVGPAVERLQDLDALLLADCDVFDLRVRIDSEPEPAGDVAHPAVGRRVIEEDACFPGFRGEDDVLSHRHDRNEHEVLMHHPDPCANGVTRRVERDRRPVEDDLARVRPVQAVEDVHQRRLARPVLAEERMHLAATEVEVDRVVGHDARKPLGDTSQLENERSGLSHRGRS